MTVADRPFLLALVITARSGALACGAGIPLWFQVLLVLVADQLGA
jgi:hypothetical protein